MKGNSAKPEVTAVTAVTARVTVFIIIEKKNIRRGGYLLKEKKGWHCPYCPQICPRHWNMKVHIQRKHRGIGEQVEAPYNSVYIQNMDSLENKSDY